MYSSTKIQTRLLQPNPSLLPWHIKDLWFAEADWGAQEGQKDYNQGL